MQLSSKRIQDGCFEFASFKQSAKPMTCILVSLTRPEFRLVQRAGRIAGPMWGGPQSTQRLFLGAVRRPLHVPILKDGKLVGIVSRSNLIQALASAPSNVEGDQLTDRGIRAVILARLADQSWTDFGEPAVIECESSRLTSGGNIAGDVDVARPGPYFFRAKIIEPEGSGVRAGPVDERDDSRRRNDLSRCGGRRIAQALEAHWAPAGTNVSFDA
jgi:hypothetical protein